MQELLEEGFSHPITSPCSLPVIMVLKQERNGNMCLYCCAFAWNKAIEKSLEVLINLICTILVLAMPNFNNKFGLKRDASKKCLGEILTHYG